MFRFVYNQAKKVHFYILLQIFIYVYLFVYNRTKFLGVPKKNFFLHLFTNIYICVFVRAQSNKEKFSVIIYKLFGFSKVKKNFFSLTHFFFSYINLLVFCIL